MINKYLIEDRKKCIKIIRICNRDIRYYLAHNLGERIVEMSNTIEHYKSRLEVLEDIAEMLE